MSQTIFIITGKVESGKTTRLGELTEKLGAMGIQMAGFLCRGCNVDGERTAYSLVDMKDGSTFLFATRKPQKGWYKYGRFYFNPEAFPEGESIIKRAIAVKSKMVIIDEVGPLELEGKGWATMLKLLLQEKELVQLWAVRENILDRVQEKWDIPNKRVFHMEQEENEETLNKIYSACQK